MPNQRNFTDSELLLDLKDRHKQDDAVRFIYRNFYSICEHYIKQNSGTEHDAEDIFQEVVVIFLELVIDGKFRGECRVGTFLYTLTRNTWINELTRKGRAKLREEKFDHMQETVDVDFSQLMESRESRSELMRLIEGLGETCKKILLAFYFDNLSMREILKTLNYENEQVVRNKKYKCLKNLEQTVSANELLVKKLKSSYWHE